MPGKLKTKVGELGRVCTRCKTYKLWVEFGLQALGTNGHSSCCVDCSRKRQRGPNQRETRLKRVYSLLPGQYAETLKKQNGVCKLCSRKTDKPLLVDHCHITGRVRGLLCINCNTALGYIEKWRSKMLQIYVYLNGD